MSDLFTTNWCWWENRLRLFNPRFELRLASPLFYASRSIYLDSYSYIYAVVNRACRPRQLITYTFIAPAAAEASRLNGACTYDRQVRSVFICRRHTPTAVDHQVSTMYCRSKLHANLTMNANTFTCNSVCWTPQNSPLHVRHKLVLSYIYNCKTTRDIQLLILKRIAVFGWC